MTRRQRHAFEEVLLCAFLGLALGLWALANLPRSNPKPPPVSVILR